METLLPFDSDERFLFHHQEQHQGHHLDLPVLGSSALDQILLDQVKNSISTSSNNNHDMERMSPDSSMDWHKNSNLGQITDSSNVSPNAIADSTTGDLTYDSDAFNSDDSNESFAELELNPNLLHDLTIQQHQPPQQLEDLSSSVCSPASSSAYSPQPNGQVDFRNNNFVHKFPLPSSPGSQSVSSVDDGKVMMPKKKKKSKRTPSNVIFSCELCSYSTKFKEHLASHMNTHISDRKYMCSDCGQTFKWSHSLKRHQETHRPDSRFTCNFCGKKFKRRDHLKTHENLHKNSNITYPCPSCGATFKNKKTLAGHVKTHSSKKFKCSKCESEFTRMTSLNRHIDCVHKGQRFPCPMCPEKFSYKSTLKDHIKAAHNQGRREFECELCGVQFAVKAYLSKHLQQACRNRAIGKSFQCATCSKSFSTKRHLNDHIKRKHLSPKQHMKLEQDTKMLSDVSRQQHPHPPPSYQVYHEQQQSYQMQFQPYQDPQFLAPPQRSAVFNCDLCHASFTNDHALQSHLNGHLPPPHTPTSHLPPVSTSQHAMSVPNIDLPLAQINEPHEENVGSLLRLVYSCSEQQNNESLTPHQAAYHDRHAITHLASQNPMLYNQHSDESNRIHPEAAIDYQMLDTLSSLDCL